MRKKGVLIFRKFVALQSLECETKIRTRVRLAKDAFLKLKREIKKAKI